MQKPFVESVRFLAGGCSSFCDHIEILLVMQVKVPTTSVSTQDVLLWLVQELHILLLAIEALFFMPDSVGNVQV